MVHMQTISQHNNFSYFLTVESAALLICCMTRRLLHPTIQRKRDLLFKLLLTENTLLLTENTENVVARLVVKTY